MLERGHEWQTIGKVKRPYHFRRPDRSPFGLAGLWESGHATESGEPRLAACLITTDANGTVSPFDDRMPVILDRQSIDSCLDPEAKADALQRLPVPAADDLLDAVAVPRLVNSPKNDGPECIASADATRE
jgi:putative SOS response-associated peptidase YedK